MNAIEQAHRRYEKNKAQRERQAEKKMGEVMLESTTVEIDGVVETLKERPMADAVITVTVDLPNAGFTFTMVKKEVLANVPNGRLTAKEFRKHFVDGLKPLLGDVV